MNLPTKSEAAVHALSISSPFRRARTCLKKLHHSSRHHSSTTATVATLSLTMSASSSHHKSSFGRTSSVSPVRPSAAGSPLANSPKHQLWHFSRGIAFASASAPNLVSTTPAEEVVCSTTLKERVVASSTSRPQGTAVVSTSKRMTTTVKVAKSTKAKCSTGTAAVTKADSEKLDTATRQSTVPEEKPLSEEDKKIRSQPPQSLLDYKVHHESFYAAKKAAPNSPNSFWHYKLYRGPPDAEGKEENVKVHYCRTKHTMERVCENYFLHEPVIGFDLEWIADSRKAQGPRRNVSLIQIASPSRVALFHVAVFPPKDLTEPWPFFKQIMESTDIIKTGVAIKGDATRLGTYFDISSRGLFELSHLYKLVTYSRTGDYKAINRRLVPLAAQVEAFLHLPLYKGSDVRASDWSKPLSMDQIVYSASDAYAGPHLFATLEHHRKQLKPCPPRPFFAESGIAIRTAPGVESEESEVDAAEAETLQRDDGSPDAPISQVIADEDFISKAEDDPEYIGPGKSKA